MIIYELILFESNNKAWKPQHLSSNIKALLSRISITLDTQCDFSNIFMTKQMCITGINNCP